MVEWGGQLIAICCTCKSRLDGDQCLPDGAYNWRLLGGPGLWCSVDESRPCADCTRSGFDTSTDTAANGVLETSEGAGEPRMGGIIGRLFGRGTG